MKMNPIIITFAMVAAMGGFMWQEAVAGGNVMISTTVENFKVKRMNIGCPKSGSSSAFVADAAHVRIDRRLLDLISEFERVNGVKVKGKTVVRDHVTQKDAVNAQSVGPPTGPGQRLCDHLRSLMGK